MKNRNFIVVIFLIICYPNLILGYSWPVDKNSNCSKQYPITGTLGEYRKNHLHNGVDIGVGAYTNVFSVIDGHVDEVNKNYVVIGNFIYYHIEPKVKKSNSVKKCDTLIGTVHPAGDLSESEEYIPHLHFIESKGGANPLRSGGLYPFNDFADPTVYYIDVVEQKTQKNFPTDTAGRPIISALSGEVDILVNAKDSMSLGSNTVGVYKVGYKIYDDFGSLVYDASNIQFDSVLGGNVGLVYAPGSTKSNYIYWATNSPWQNLYFSPWGAGFADGVYYISAYACDLRGSLAHCIEADTYQWLEVGVDYTEPEVTSYFPQGSGISTNISQISLTIKDPEVNGYASGINLSTLINGITITPSVNGYWTFSSTSDGSVEAEYVVLEKLQENTTYTVSINAEDLAENGVSFSWSFSTVGCDVCEEWDPVEEKCKLKDCPEKPCYKSLGCTAKTGECEYEPECDFSCEICVNDQCVPDPSIVLEPCTKCVNGEVVPCDKCEECNPQTGQCEPIDPSVVCNDGDLCTQDLCDPSVGCVNPPKECTDPCDVGCDSETGQCIKKGCGWCGVCENGQCRGCDPSKCETCDSATGQCVSICNMSACEICENGQCISACKEENCEQCINGACQSICGPCQECRGGVCKSRCGECQECVNGGCTDNCDDKNPCTEDICVGTAEGGKTCQHDEKCKDPCAPCNKETGECEAIECEDKDCMYNLGCVNGECQYEEVKCPPPSSSEWEERCYKCVRYTVYFCKKERACESESNTSCSKIPHCDLPDENVFPGNPASAKPIPNIDSKSRIGVLLNGMASNMFSLLGEFKWKARVVLPSELSPMLDVDLLIIPSGGLSNIQSPIFKDMLELYVLTGGNLLVMAQQYGRDYELLPGGIKGYGWREDQSCYSGSSYIDFNHQILSSISTPTVDVHIDGFFMGYPSDSSVLLRRTSNAEPSLIVYSYGEGTVILTSMYSDFSLTIGGLSKYERGIIRDAITYGVNPAYLPEGKPGDTINYSLKVTNTTSVTATAILIEVLDPDRKAIKEKIAISMALEPGEYTTIPVSYPSQATDPLGIWHTRYTLLRNGEIIQPAMEDDSGRFALRVPIENPYVPKDVLYTILIPRDEWAPGEKVEFTLMIRNNSPQDKHFRIYYDWFWGSSWKFVDSVTVPANSLFQKDYITEPTFAHPFHLRDRNFLTVIFFEEGRTTPVKDRIYNTCATGGPACTHPFSEIPEDTNSYAGFAFKGFTVGYPPITVSVRTDKYNYARGEEVKVNVEVYNEAPVVPFNGYLFVDVYGVYALGIRNKIYSSSVSVTVPAMSSSITSFVFSIPKDSNFGVYVVEVRAIDSSQRRLYDSYSVVFRVLEPELSISPIFPEYFSFSTPVSFEVMNIGEVQSGEAELVASLRDPDGNVVWSDRKLIPGIAPGSITTVSFNVQIGTIRLGNYLLDYSLAYDGKSLIGYRVFSSALDLSLNLDKTSYRLNESANISGTVRNLGDFLLEPAVELSIPGLGYYGTQDIGELKPGGVKTFSFSVSIPSNAQAGNYNVDAVTSLPSGDFISSSNYFAVKKLTPTLLAKFSKPSYKIRETANLTLSAYEPGNFVGSITAVLMCEIPDLGFSDKRTITLSPGVPLPITYSFNLPETLSSNYHNGFASIRFPNGVSKTTPFAFYIPESALKILPLSKNSYSAGETVTVDVLNEGGVDTEFGYIVTLSKENIKIVNEMGWGVAQAGGKASFSFSIPEDAVSGNYRLYVATTNFNTGRTADLYSTISITGTSAVLSLRTDKDVYLMREPITGFASITNTAIPVLDANLNLKVIRFKEAPLLPNWPNFQRNSMHTGMSTFTGNILNPKIRWTSAYSGFSGVVADDLDGDGWVEIVFIGMDSSGEASLFVLDGWDGRLKWKSIETAPSVRIDPYKIPSIDDVDGNGKKEIFLSNNNSVLSFSANGDLIWSFPFDYGPVSDVTVSDIEDDGDKEVIAVADGEVWAIDAKTGTPKWESLESSPDVVLGATLQPAVGDINGDGLKEIVLSADWAYVKDEYVEPGILAFKMSGEFLWMHSASGESYLSPPVIAQFDNSAVAVQTDQSLKILNGIDGALLWSKNIGCIPTYYYNCPSPAAGDLNNDGILDLVVVSSVDSSVQAYDQNGNLLWKSIISAPLIFSNPALSDIDNDGGLEVVFLSEEQVGMSLHALNGEDGSGLWEFDGVEGTGSLAIADLDGDGEVEIAGSEGWVVDYESFWRKYEPPTWTYFNRLDYDFTRNGLWIASDDGVWFFYGEGFTQYTIADGLPDSYIYEVDVDENGNVWAGTSFGAGMFDGISWVAYDVRSNCGFGPNGDYVRDVKVGSGVVWFATDDTGVCRFDGESWKRFIPDENICTIGALNILGVDKRTGDAWVIPCGGNGVRWIKGDMVFSFTTANSPLLDDWVWGTIVDGNGNAWFGTCNGISTFDGTTWVNYPNWQNGLGGGCYAPVDVDEMGRTWVIDISSGEDLFYLDGGKWKRFDLRAISWRGTSLDDLATGRKGDLWLLEGYELFLYSPGLLEKTSPQMSPSGEFYEEVFWEKDLTVSLLPSEVKNLTEAIGTLGISGNFYFKGLLTSSLGQKIAEDLYPFSIVEGDLYLSLSTDKNLYKKGDVVTVSGEAVNLSDVYASSVSFVITARGAQFSDETEVYSAQLDLHPKEHYPFSFTIPAQDSGDITLRARLYQASSEVYSLTHKYEVSEPVVYVSAKAPEIVGDEPFDIEVTLRNDGKVGADLTVTLEAPAIFETRDVNLQPGGVEVVTLRERINQDTNFRVIISGDHTETIALFVVYGLSAVVDVEPSFTFAEGEVSIPFTVINTGLLSYNVPVSFTLMDTSGNTISQITKRYLLAPSSVPEANFAGDVLNFTLAQGRYTLRYTTTGFTGESSINVIKPSGMIYLNPSTHYPEGVVEVPFTVSNTSPVSGTFDVFFELRREDNFVRPSTITVYLNAAGTVSSDYSGTLLYSLTAGNYTLYAYGDNFAEPLSASFMVLKRENAVMDVVLYPSSNGKKPAEVILSNLGYDDFKGSIELSTDFWASSTSVVLPQGASNIPFDFLIDLSTAEVGVHTLDVTLLNSSNNVLAHLTKQFEVKPAIFEITEIPSYKTFNAGENGKFQFKVLNKGDKVGKASLSFKVFDLTYEEFSFIEPSEEYTFTFTVPIPPDIEERDYPAIYELKTDEGELIEPSKGVITFGVNSIKLEVNATLDKRTYSLDEIAHFTMGVTSIGTVSNIELIAKVQYGDYVEESPFVLTTTGTILNFDVPISTFEPNRLFYEIHFTTGRSAYINMMIVHEKKEEIWLYTDKDIYLPGEDVFVTVEASEDGSLSISAPDANFSAEVSLTAFTPFDLSFTLPVTLPGGVKLINYSFRGKDYSYEYIVDSYLAKFVMVRLDRDRYQNQDTLLLDAVIEANQCFTGYLDFYLLKPDGEKVLLQKTTQSIEKGYTYLTIGAEFSSDQAGTHRLLLMLYLDEARTQLMTTESLLFTVGDFEVLRVFTDKDFYESGYEGANAGVEMYALEATTGTLSLFLDGELLYQREITFTGYGVENFKLSKDDIKPLGEHTILARFERGGLKSEKQTIFSTIDTTPPEIIVSGVSDGIYYNTSVTPVIEVHDFNPSFTSISLNGLPFESGGEITEDGDYTLYVEAIDGGGNLSQKILSFVIDKTPPEIYLSGVETSTCYNYDLSPWFYAIDENPEGISATLNGSPFPSGGTVSEEGDYALDIFAWDKARNSSSLRADFVIDKTPPAIIVEGVIHGAYYNTDVTPVITLYDSHLATSLLTLNGIPYSSGTPITEEGSYTLYSYASDCAGNSFSQSLTFTVDKTPPQIIITGVEDGAEYNDVVTPVVEIIEPNLSHHTITLNGEPFTSGTPITEDGDYTLYVYAEDLAGNISEETVKFSLMFVKLEVSKELLTNYSNLLIWFTDGLCPNSEAETTGIRDFLKETLSETSAYISFAYTNLEFLKGLRSGLYNTFILIDVEDGQSQGVICSCDGDDETCSINECEREESDDNCEVKSKGDEEECRKKECKDEEDCDDDCEIEDDEDWLSLTKIAVELTELVNSGAGLIVIKSTPSEWSKMREVLGVHFEGRQDRRVIVLENSAITDPGEITLEGERVAVEIALETAEPVAYYKEKCGEDDDKDNKKSKHKKDDNCEDEDKEPAIAINNLGKGASVIFTFNPTAVSGKDVIKEIVQKSVEFVRPGEIVLNPLDVFGVRITVENLRKAVDLLITENFPEGSTPLLALEEGEISESGILWQFNLPELSKKNLRYFAKLTEATGTYTFTTIVDYFKKGTLKHYGTYPLSVTLEVSPSDLYNVALNALNLLEVGKKDRKKKEKAIKLVEGVMMREVKNLCDIEKNIEDIEKAISEVKKITTDDTFSARQSLDAVLIYWLRRWWREF